MPEYTCLTCKYTTSKLSSWKNHNKSKTHLKLIESMPIEEQNISESELENNEFKIKYDELILKHNELEIKNNELKIKHDKLETKNNELEIKNNELKIKLTFTETELKNKIEIIDILKNSHQSQSQIIQHQPQFQSQPQPLVKVPFNHQTYLEKERLNAISWTNFKKDYFVNPTYNNAYIKAWTHPLSKTNFNVLKSIDAKDYSSNSDKVLLNMICKTMSNIDVNKRPLYCSSVKDLKFYYVNDENKWIKANDSIFEKIFNFASHSLFMAQINTEEYIKTSTLYKDYGLISGADIKCGGKPSFEQLKILIISGIVEVKDNFIQKLKIGLSKICKTDNEAFMVDNT